MNRYHVCNHNQRSILQDDIDQLVHAMEHGYSTVEEEARLPDMLAAITEWDERQHRKHICTEF